MSNWKTEKLYQRLFALEDLIRRMSLQIVSLRQEVKDLKIKLEEKEKQGA